MSSSPTVDPTPFRFLASSGEVAARLRELDWSCSPLGAPETWPQTLRVTANLLLASKAQIALFWGPRFALLYNDAYRRVLGEKHPRALGKPGSEVWSEIWEDQLRELLEGVVRSGEAFSARDLRFVIERHGFVEETYFDVSYDPVHAESGDVSGVYCIMSETTERVVGERRLALLSDLAARNATALTEREACVLAMHTLQAKPDVAFALAYLDDELQAATSGAAEQWAAADPRLVKTLPLASGGRAGRLIVGINPRRPYDEGYRTFLELVADQLATALTTPFVEEALRWLPDSLRFPTQLTGALAAATLSAPGAAQAPSRALDDGADTRESERARELLASVASQLELARVRRESERALHYQSEQHLTLLNQAPLGIYLIDADFRFVEVNPVAAPLFRDVPGGVIGRSFEDISRLLWPRDYADEMVRTFRRTLETGEPHVTAESGGPGRDRGSDEYYEWRVDRITLPDGRFGLVCYLRDISQQKQAAAARAYLAAIVDSADDAILSKNLDGIIQSCNAAAERLFGYSKAELVGRSVRTLIPPERQSEEDEILARLRRGERIQHFETVRLTKDGRRIDISLTISPVRDESGTIIGASKIGRDITALKQAEAERIRLLQENAAVTETLNNVGALVASDLDRGKVVQAVTDAATELTGAAFGAFFYNVLDERGETYTLYTISGVPRETFSQFPMPRNTAVFEPTFKGTGVVRSDDITREPQYGQSAPHYGMPAGHLPVRSYLAVPVKGRGGNVIGGLFFGHSEIGRFKAHHERIAVGIAVWAAVALENSRLYESVQEASRLKDDFLASLSHELRTPLNAILGYVRMLQSGIIAPEKRQRSIDTIERNATSLTQIVEDVLDISRIVSGKLRLDVQPVDFPVVVRNAIDVIAPTAEAKGVRIETVIDPHAAPISGDPERLQQVIWNLLSNGVKFTKRGGKVQVRLERVNSHVELTVSDTGIGITPEFLPHVFERFRQAEGGTTRERGGLGLGLSIARQLTELHGGRIDVSSAGLGHGASFCVQIPLMSVQRPREPEPRVHPRATSSRGNIGAGTLNGIHVLAVDDEPDALALVSEVLESVGARLTTAQSAADALEKLASEVPDVVVTDLGMPRMDGFALIERLRQHPNPRVREIPAAALTAYARSEDRMKVLQAGFQIHLAKPIDPAELVTTIASLAKRVVVKTPLPWQP